MRIQLGFFFEFTRAPKDEPIFEHRDNDTMVESTGPGKVGFTVPHSAEPYAPEKDRTRDWGKK